VHDYFYQKSYFRPDGQVYVKRFSRSFPINQQVPHYDNPVGSNVREASISRAKSKVRLLAFCNPQFVGLLTLTFSDCPSEELAHSRFDLFRRQVARYYLAWQFLGVKEFQKRGSIHFHLLVNFCPAQVHRPLWDNPNQQQCDLWKYGISDYQVIKGDDAWRTELYLLKYLSKSKQKLFKTYYIRSRGLNTIEPRLYDTFEPMHPLAENIFLTHIGNDFVDSFEVLEYNYIISNNNGEQ